MVRQPGVEPGIDTGFKPAALPFRHWRRDGARGELRTPKRMGLSHPGMPIPVTRANSIWWSWKDSNLRSPEGHTLYRRTQLPLCHTTELAEGTGFEPALPVEVVLGLANRSDTRLRHPSMIFCVREPACQAICCTHNITFGGRLRSRTPILSEPSRYSTPVAGHPAGAFRKPNLSKNFGGP
jgi:hypothetical protein